MMWVVMVGLVGGGWSVSLCPGEFGPVPEMTVQVARAAFPKGCLAIRLRDGLGPVFADTDFADLFAARGKPGLSPAMVTMVLLLQYCEDLSDRQAAAAVAARIDWKYALGLELTDTGFDHSVLSQFRDRLVAHDAGQRVLDRVLAAAGEKGLLKTRGRARTDSTHVLAAIRGVNRLELVGETLRAALNELAEAAPDWLAAHAAPEWFDRYGRRVENYQLPKTDAERQAWAAQVGADGMRLWDLLTSEGAPSELTGLTQVQLVRRVWVQEYTVPTPLMGGRVVVMRDPKDRPPAAGRLVSPYEPDARTGMKRQHPWDGYKLHLTETCDPDRPRLITHVETTDATVTDFEMIPVVHAGLAGRDRLPGEHLVDTGYVTAREIVASRTEHGVELVGPVMLDTTRQGVAGQGYAATDFTADWDAKKVTCPQDKRSVRWSAENNEHGHPIIKVRFRATDCRPYPARQSCTSATSHGRTLKLLPRSEHETLIRVRQEQKTEAWQQKYQPRAGIEGTINQAVRRFGARHARYRGGPKTRLQHQLTAAALNLTRIEGWHTGTPLARTRTSRFAALNPAA
jgi:transposase